MTASVTCREFVGFLADYLANALRPEEVDAFNAHLAECPLCVAYMNSYQASVHMGRKVLDPDDLPVPDDVPEDLVQAILAVRPKA